MANKGGIKGIVIEIGGNTQPLEKALSNVTSTSVALSNELKQVEKQLKFSPGNSELVRQQQELLGKQIETTADKLQTLKEAQKQVEQQFSQGKITAENYRAFSRELIATEGALNGLKNKMSELQVEEGRAGNATKQLNTLFEATGTSVDNFAGALGSKLVNAIKDGTASSKQLETAINKIGTTTLGTNVDLDKMKQALNSVDDGASIKSVKKDLDTLSTSAGEAKQAVNDLGGELGGLAAGVAAGGGLAGVIQKSFDVSSLNTKIEISMDVPPESIQTVKDAVNTVSAYGVDAESALEGVRRQWALNKDASDESNQAVVEGAGTIVAAYSGIDFTELIQETNEISKSLGITNEDAIGLTNALLKIGFPPEQLDIIAEYGKQLYDAGYNAQEVQAIMAAGVETGTFNIDNLLDGLKEGRIRVAEFGQEVPKAMQDLLTGTNISSQQMQEWGRAVATGGEGGKKAMQDVATALMNVEDETKRNALGTQIFGR